MGSNSLTGDRTWAPIFGAWSLLRPWTAREVSQGLFKWRSLIFFYIIIKQDDMLSLVFCVSFFWHVSFCLFCLFKVLSLAWLKIFFFLFILVMKLFYLKLFIWQLSNSLMLLHWDKGWVTQRGSESAWKWYGPVSLLRRVRTSSRSYYKK